MLSREQVHAFAGIILVSLLAWIYLIDLAASMGQMQAMQAVDPRPWSMIDVAAMLAMWWIMMVAMMLPTAAPMVMTFEKVNRSRRQRGQAHAGTIIFVLGYLVAWGGFSIAATMLQWGLEELALLSAMPVMLPDRIGGALLVAAGIYQFTPLKQVCLHHCRSPFDLVLNRWRDGSSGALLMGLDHGLYCLGCCWVLMTLLFVFGVMNLLWIAALTLLVLAEKVLPHGPVIGRLGGGVMMIAGCVMMV